MKQHRCRTEKLFRFVCVVSSLVMLFSCIACRIGIMRTETEINRICNDIGKAEKEAEIYRVKLENRLSLDELECIATEKLGMHRPTSAQLFFSMTAG